MGNSIKQTAGTFDFKNPPHEYGEVPFFWWHGDDITREKLTWILEQLKDKHICGLQINYCHSNSGGHLYGLTMKSNPKPFSEKWWELIGWFVDECRKYGMSVSLSDYTLGSPGQEYYVDWVIEKHPEMIGQQLVLNADGEVEIQRKPDSMNPMAVGIGDAVVDEFYGAFERHLPGECGKGINYFFSDELNFNIKGNLWCDDFKEQFLSRKGYDITEKWKAIFEDIGPETPKIRLDYYDVIVQLSEERYFQAVYNWHEERGMTFGCDHGGRGTWMTEFGDYFRTMKWNQGPGNDQPHLASNITKSKVSASIAHMYRRPRVWLEGFYGSGWATGSDDVADATFRNFALGHNLLSLHGLYYSTHGSMWEWAPPCNHHHMPYWGQMEDFLGCTKRLSYLLGQGVHRCDVAIVYPVAAEEADAPKGKEAATAAFSMGKYLYTHGIDFDYIDFESVQRAEVENGKLCVSGEQFRTVVVPNMETVRFGMMEKLAEFARAGGQVIFRNCVPTASDRIGRDDDQLKALVQEILETGCIVETPEEAAAKMAQHYVPDFACSAPNPFMQHRIIEGRDYYMVYRVPTGAKLSFRAKGYPVLLNPWDGSMQRLDAFEGREVCAGADSAWITELTMPMHVREVFLVMFEQDEEAWKALPVFVPYTGEHKLIGMEGQWQSELVPTMDNAYGDWKLPAFNGFVGAEARKMEYCYSDSPDAVPQNAEWKQSVYSYGPHFWFADSSADEAKLIAAEAPVDGMTEYRFSMRTGVENDAGAQGSYHGLKGCLSDGFLVMGKKRVTFVNSDSVYEGEGPYYFYTTVAVDEPTEVQIETGDFKPDCIWIDHQAIDGQQLTLAPGRHYILLRFPCGGRSYFVLRRSNEFRQTLPLVTSWFGNTDILPLDALPERSAGYCFYRFMTPPGAVKMKVNAWAPVKAYIGGRELAASAENEFVIDGEPASVQVTLCAKQLPGACDTGIFTEAVMFETGAGAYDADSCPDAQGLDYYSGGIRLKKTFEIARPEQTFFTAKSDIGCAMEVLVNGQKAGALLTPPYRCDITKYLKAGDNEITVTAYTSLHNHMKTIPTAYNDPIDLDNWVLF